MNVPPPSQAHKHRGAHPLSRFFTIQPATTTAASALSYVPLVFISRAIAFVRLLVIARLLGEKGKAQFGLYQPAQELINWTVPIVLFGIADVAERYASRMEKEGRLRTWLATQYRRVILIGAAVAALLILASPWLASIVLHLTGAERFRGITLIALCALTIFALALYQHLAAVLRGMRAYSASAALEVISAALFLLFASLAAWRGSAVSLIIAYAGSVILPVAFFAAILRRHLSRLAHEGTSPIREATQFAAPRFNRFAAWSFVRLLLMMTFSAISIVGVGGLVDRDAAKSQAAAHDVTADYAMPYRIAQLLSYVALTLWSSTYGIAARAWSHGQIRRAHVQLFRVGKFGAVIITLIAVALLLTRGFFAHIEWQYADSINNLLPPLLAVFIWFGLLAFCCTFADLHESPQRGAIFWAVAVAAQVATLLIIGHTGEPKQTMILACAIGIGIALLIIAPLILWRPFRFSATAVPMVLLALAPLSLFTPLWVVDGLAPPIMLGAIGFLYISGLLVRPIDRRAWRRRRNSMLTPKETDFQTPI